ncbi:MAG TPA: SxtJ family membrane protein [Lacipirellulaceae bacterium]|jgi:predicted membrane metal-binding protein|nr:SxtJ family membrane protein [Lacipirellulaceae bacterium]
MVTVLEPVIPREQAPHSSDRSFGYVFAAVFFLVGCWPLLHREPLRWWALAIGVIFAVVALARPQVLRPLNRIWLALGHLMERVVSPLVMGTIFFVCITPTGWILRWRGKDPLSRKWRPDLPTYWIERDSTPPRPEAMKNQF